MPFRVATLTAGESQWTPIASGSVVAYNLAHESGRAAVDLHALQVANSSAVDLESFYEWLSSVELEFGSRFRGIAQLWRGHDSALARITTPAGVSVAGYGMHPAVLDACFHVLGAALRTPARPIDAPFLLSHVERLSMLRRVVS